MMRHLTLKELPEVFVSRKEISSLVVREMKKGHLRKLAPRLYSKNLIEAPEKLIKRHLWSIIAALFPGALIADRTAIENVPSSDGSIFLISTKKQNVKLPGITIKPRKGFPPLESDKPFIKGLYLSSPARAYLENCCRSRARTGISRTLTRKELEEKLEGLLQRNGEVELSKLREDTRQIAPLLHLEKEFKTLNELIGTLLGTKNTEVFSHLAKGRVAKLPYDSQRVDLFQHLRDFLILNAPHIRPSKTKDQLENLAFFEAYFSNFIEGTEFEVNEAHQIIFDGKIPKDRPADAHDIIGTYRLVSNLDELQKVPTTFDELILASLLKASSDSGGKA